MRFLLPKFLIGLIVSILLSSECFAQSVPVRVDGVDGVWFPKDMASRVLAEVEELALVRAKLSLVEAKLEIHLDSLNSLKNFKELQDRHIEDLSVTLEQVIHQKEEVEKSFKEYKAKKESFLRHPALWFSIGSVVTVGLVVGAVKILDVTN